ncbi:hypothetical protein KAU33_15475 [Candidatus Dependentiae bacterium]|nr:hypothetical protein [Candidatus Dependentiae bacterium]
MISNLKDEIIEFVKENPRVSSVDTVEHFDCRIGTVLDAISELEKEKRLERVWVVFKYELRVINDN